MHSIISQVIVSNHYQPALDHHVPKSADVITFKLTFSHEQYIRIYPLNMDLFIIQVTQKPLIFRLKIKSQVNMDRKVRFHSVSTSLLVNELLIYLRSG